ncbi:7092_t:CDS:2, partial [Acaulospora morrowiae]
EELEVPISHNGIEGLARPDELEVSDDESEDTFDELEYESEDVEEEEGYYTGERSEEEETMDKGIPSPAVYLTVLEEIPTLEDDEEYKDEKPREKRESSATGGEARSRDEESDLPGPLNEDLTYQNDAEGATNLDSLNHHQCGGVGSDDTIRPICVLNGVARDDEDDAILSSLREESANPDSSPGKQRAIRGDDTTVAKLKTRHNRKLRIERSFAIGDKILMYKVSQENSRS